MLIGSRTGGGDRGLGRDGRRTGTLSIRRARRGLIVQPPTFLRAIERKGPLIDDGAVFDWFGWVILGELLRIGRGGGIGTLDGTVRFHATGALNKTTACASSSDLALCCCGMVLL